MYRLPDFNLQLDTRFLECRASRSGHHND